MQSPLVDKLFLDYPDFHLKSQTTEVPNAEDHFFENRGTITEGMPRTSYTIGKAVLEFMAENVKSYHVSIETGCGCSTVMFSQLSSHHTCINPDKTSNQMVRDYLTCNNLITDKLSFIEESSEYALPALVIDNGIDIALIDGSHSFPIPMIDFYYIDRLLKCNSLLLLDNVEINTVRILDEYLKSEPAYRLETTFNQGAMCCIYRKLSSKRTMGWLRQNINLVELNWFNPTKLTFVDRLNKIFTKK